MKSFEYATPSNLKEATALLSDTWGSTEILAGGTDLVTALKQGLTSPKRVVSLRKVKDLHGIDSSRDEIRVGAMTTLREFVANAQVRKHFPSLVAAAEGIGSPQLLAAGTVGGDLCQRPRCWFYRNGLGLLARQGDVSLVREGDNRYHAIFGTDGPALFVSASSLGPALIALGATLTAAGPGGTRAIAAKDFFRAPASESERETALKPNEILQDIKVPLKDLRNATYEVRHRHGLDWPYVTASVAYSLSGGSATGATVVLGHVAATPWLAAAAGSSLVGPVNEAGAMRSAEAAVQGAKPLSGNGYKIQMVKAAVKRAILAAAAPATA
jgi:xanthine dehydrogenase YagS FAD-binding subunit